MGKTQRAVLVEIFKNRYRKASRRDKGLILEEVCRDLEVGRRQARRLLTHFEIGRPRKPRRRGPKARYQDPEFIAALKLIWRTTHYMCSRHLKASLPEWLPHIEADRGTFPLTVRERLLSVSAPTIDRLLTPFKVNKGKTLTRSGGFRDEIPIQESIWDIQVPGYMESDTVHHCGGSTFGEYISSLVMVDIATIWTEARGVFSRGSLGVVRAIEDIELGLPFPIRGYDCDNGGEVLNQYVLSYFQHERIERGKEPVTVTRSREYRKNDNAHVEQRNNSVARRWLGYDRLGFEELLPLINHYYKDIVCPLINHFFPTFKLSDKKRIGSRTKRVYNDPVTPYARVMASEHVDKEKKEALMAIHCSLNPLALLRKERDVRGKIDAFLRNLKEQRNTASLLSHLELLQRSFPQQATPLDSKVTAYHPLPKPSHVDRKRR